jgi:hypothetical protein
MITNCIALRNNPTFVEFRNYILSFYAYDGIYPTEGLTVAIVEKAIFEYLKKVEVNNYTWGGGDSIDRERVRYEYIEEILKNA